MPHVCKGESPSTHYLRIPGFFRLQPKKCRCSDYKKRKVTNQNSGNNTAVPARPGVSYQGYSLRRPLAWATVARRS